MVTVPDLEEPGSSTKDHFFKNIVVVNITSENLNLVWPDLLITLKNADYVALDLELSGLGNLSGIRQKNVEDRYAALREAATSRSILSLGIAVFNLLGKEENSRSLSFSCRVYNILTLCSQAFSVEPDALQFLSRHSFDFNKWVTLGVGYSTSNTKANCTMRSLFSELLAIGCPLFFHNGLNDLVFLYHHFYSPLPESWGEFCNALTDIFTREQPLCDSKYLAEFQSRMSASFLEFVFRKCQGDNVRESLGGRYNVDVKFTPPPEMISGFCERVECSLPEGFPNHLIPMDLKGTVCPQFASHGFCRKNADGTCSLVHDVDLVLDVEWQRKEKERQKKKRKYDHLKPDAVLAREQEELAKRKKMEVVMGTDFIKNKTRLSVSGCHRAGIDAFMTGFAVLVQERAALWKTGGLDPQHLNRIPLSGKVQPFLIQPTNFAGSCQLHEERFAMLRKRRQNGSSS